jgi:BRO family, N-terminal domain
MATKQLIGQVSEQSTSPFDSTRRVREDGSEFWTGRDLMGLLGYSKWQHFGQVIKKSSRSCENSGNPVAEHYLPTTRRIESHSGRPAEDWELSRFACYLVAMNGDPEKLEIAAAQCYFAGKTREAEVAPQVDEIKKLETHNENLRLQIQLEILNQNRRPETQASFFAPAHPDKLPVEKAIPVDLPPISLRTQINNIAQRPIAKIRNRLLAQGTDPRTASSEAASIIWRRINKEFVDRYHFDLKARTRKGKKTRLQVAEEAGKLTELYTLVVALYGSESSVSVEANPENS